MNIQEIIPEEIPQNDLFDVADHVKIRNRNYYQRNSNKIKEKRMAKSLQIADLQQRHQAELDGLRLQLQQVTTERDSAIESLQRIRMILG